MRAVFWYDGRHRNDGPPLFLRQAALRNMDKLGLSAADHKIPIGDLRKYGKYDIGVWIDFGEDGLPESYAPMYGDKKVYWCSDSHLGMDYRLEKAKEADVVFVAIPGHIEKFKESVGHDKVFWLPHAGEPTCYTKKHVVKRYDTCFIGHIPNDERADLLDALFSNVDTFFYGQRFFEDASQIYNESKIVFNHCIGNEANMRVFEGTLSGSMLLTSYSEDVERLGYKDKEHVVYYRTPEEMVELARYYIDNDEEREKIAEAGYKHTLNNHTYLHRVERILEEIV